MYVLIRKGRNSLLNQEYQQTAQLTKDTDLAKLAVAAEVSVIYQFVRCVHTAFFIPFLWEKRDEVLIFLGNGKVAKFYGPFAAQLMQQKVSPQIIAERAFQEKAGQIVEFKPKHAFLLKLYDSAIIATVGITLAWILADLVGSRNPGQNVAITAGLVCVASVIIIGMTLAKARYKQYTLNSLKSQGILK